MWFDQYYQGLPIKKGTKKQLAKRENSLEYQNIFQSYFSMCMDMFGYRNLPETCDERTIERSFLLYGMAIIADYNGSLISPYAARGGDYNIYGYPLNGWGYGVNGFNHQFNFYVPSSDNPVTLKTASGLGIAAPNAVLGYDNPTYYPPINYIMKAAERQSDLYRAVDVAVANMKSPFIVTCDESVLKTVKEAFDQRDENVAVILAGPRTIETTEFKVFPTATDSSILKAYWEQFRANEAYLAETLGIKANQNPDKRERLNIPEVEANYEIVMYNLMKRFNYRQIWVDTVNKFFGTNIEVYIKNEEGTEDESTDALLGLSEDDPVDDTVLGDED